MFSLEISAQGHSMLSSSAVQLTCWCLPRKMKDVVLALSSQDLSCSGWDAGTRSLLPPLLEAGSSRGEADC